jgi:hypothetical protein
MFYWTGPGRQTEGKSLTALLLHKQGKSWPFFHFFWQNETAYCKLFSQEFSGVQRRQKYEVIFVSTPGTGTTKLFAAIINTVV